MRSRITYANVAATLAVFLALGGSAYAVTVNGGDVVNGSLTGKDIKNNSIKAVDVAGLGANVVVRAGQTGTGTIAASSSASCNPGETLISGGYGSGGNQVPVAVQNAPVSNGGAPTAWQVLATVPNPGPSVSIEVTAFAVCAS